MRVPSSDLWTLMQGMSPSEQRYCKIALDKSGQPDTLMKLWNVGIGGEPEVAENELLISDKKLFATRMKLSKAKNSLFEFLLNTLVEYSSSSMPQVEAFQMLNQCQLLYDRGMPRQCLNKLNKLQQWIVNYEIMELLGSVTRLKIKVLMEIGSMREFEAFVKQQKAEFPRNRKILEEQLEVLGAAPEWYLKLRKAISGKSPVSPEIIELISGKFGAEKGKHLISFEARANYLAFQGVAYSLVGRKVDALNLRMELHQMFTKNPVQIQRRLVLYLSNLHNIVSNLLLMMRLKDLEPYLRLQENVAHTYAKYPKKSVLRRAALYSFSSRLGVLLLKMDLKGALKHIRKFEFPDPAEENREFREQMEILHYQAALVYFYFDENSQAAKIISRYYSGMTTESRKDLQCAIRALEAAVHFAAGNYDFLEYQIHNGLRAMRDLDQAHLFEFAFLKTIQQIIAEPGKRKELLSELAQRTELKATDVVMNRFWKEKLLNPAN